MSKLVRIPFAAVLAASLVVATTGSAFAFATLAQRCEAGKTLSSGKYAACLLKARKYLVLTGDSERYATIVAKCEAKQAVLFQKYENKAGSGNCTTENDATDVGDFLGNCVSALGGYLGGGTLPADLSTCYSDLGACESDLTTCDDDRSTCQSDLASCLALSSNGLLVTGQMKCWNQSGSQVACAGTGQDGELQAGTVPTYADNGDGTVTDQRTGLTWEKLSDDGGIHDKDTTMIWSDAFAKIDALNAAVFAGHDDWRLPNARELESIMDFNVDFPTTGTTFDSGCTPGCAATACSCTRSNFYWSSTSYKTDPTCAWAENFGLGDRTAALKTSTYGVRAVRGGL